MGRFFIYLLSAALSIQALPSLAKLGNNVVQNQAQYGNEISIEEFPNTTKNFSGYRSYSIDSKWKLKAFFADGIVRSEHLIPKKGTPTLNRSEVRVWAEKMFSPNTRGSYKKKLVRYRAEGHFFDKGLVSYEYYIENKATKGYIGVKVLLYENNKNYSQINPKAYI